MSMDVDCERKNDDKTIYCHEDVLCTVHISFNQYHILVLDEAKCDKEHDANDEVQLDERLAESEILVDI
jgi:hypothetical protein